MAISFNVMMIVVIIAAVIASAAAVPVTFTNTGPRYDYVRWERLWGGSIEFTNRLRPQQGKIMDAHDGTTIYSEGYYWYAAAAYGSCVEPTRYGCDQTADHCGFQDVSCTCTCYLATCTCTCTCTCTLYLHLYMPHVSNVIPKFLFLTIRIIMLQFGDHSDYKTALGKLWLTLFLVFDHLALYTGLKWFTTSNFNVQILPW